MIVTVSVLVVSPALNVMVPGEPTVKNSATGAIVTVVATLDLPSIVAVTVAVPLFSEIVVSDSTRVTAGVSSSSVMASVSAVGLVTPAEFVALPKMVTDMSCESRSSSTAAIVTVPVLVVAPAAMVSVVPVWVKSVAAVFAPAAAVTVMVVSAVDELLSEAVTVVEPPFSEIDLSRSESVSVTLG